MTWRTDWTGTAPGCVNWRVEQTGGKAYFSSLHSSPASVHLVDFHIDGFGRRYSGASIAKQQQTQGRSLSPRIVLLSMARATRASQAVIAFICLRVKPMSSMPSSSAVRSCGARRTRSASRRGHKSRRPTSPPCMANARPPGPRALTGRPCPARPASRVPARSSGRPGSNDVVQCPREAILGLTGLSFIALR